MKWTNFSARSRLLILGVTLIIATNAVVIAGVIYNRSGKPESVLRLSQRELPLPYEWQGSHENSGIALNINWRVLDARVDNLNGYGSRKLQWLDQVKMAALGFNTALHENSDDFQGKEQLSKEVYLVLEMDGLAHKQAVEYAKQHLAVEGALCTASPCKKEFLERTESARKDLEREEHESSRLFVVDAGLDEVSLRAAHPDSSQYAIVRGKISPHWSQSNLKKPIFSGYISNLSINGIDVPSNFHPVLKPLIEARRIRERDTQGIDKATPFEVTVAFGKRLEPWVTDVSAKAIAK